MLALVAPSADGDVRRELEDVLGCPADEAFAAARELLADPHAELVLGSAVWHDPGVATERLIELIRRLSPPADAGPIPSQAQADAWARERTLGLIEKFPIEVESGASLVLLLATAIAARVSWAVPFAFADEHELSLPADDAFARKPMLRDYGGADWRGFVDTDIGVVAALSARSQHGLLVTSVIGDPTADPAAMLDAAQRLAVTVACGDRPDRKSLFDLPLGGGPAWRVEEERLPTSDRERYETLLPAWEVRSDHDLLGAGELGFGAAGTALIALLPPGGYTLEAKQRAMARYTREGFEAAAVTGVGVRSSLQIVPETTVRTARIEFTKPHAVVAVTTGDGPWDGIPVFSAWVAEGVAATPE